VERSETPGSLFHHEQLIGFRYRTLRALDLLTVVNPGVSPRSTPGFMLSPATRVLKRQVDVTEE